MSDARNLLFVQKSDLFVWDSYSSNLAYINLLNLTQDSDRVNRWQCLTCTDIPRFEVENLTFNKSLSHVAIWGRDGIVVMQIPQRGGKYAEFDGGKDVIICSTFSIGERQFTSRQGLQLLQVRWHPGSAFDTHLALLTSDNMFSIYSLADPDKPLQVIPLEEDENVGASPPSRLNLGRALGEVAASFDFGQPLTLQQRSRMGATPSKEESETSPVQVWPAYVLKGNGDILLVYSRIGKDSEPPLRLPVQGPLTVLPAAEDNYGLDACSILCLHTKLPLLVFATCDGNLHHCLIMSAGSPDSPIQSEPSSLSWRSSLEVSLYEALEEPTLYVLESVEIELFLTSNKLMADDPAQDNFTCPLRIIPDPEYGERYQCCHAAGIHSVVLPWVSSFHAYFSDDREVNLTLPQTKPAIVEHLICTKPIDTSPPGPIQGIDVVTEPSLGSTLLVLTSDLEFVDRPLRTLFRPGTPPLTIDRPSEPVTSPLRGLHREPFDQFVASKLMRSTSNPLLKSSKDAELSVQERFQLLICATKVLREEYILKQDDAAQELQTRVRLLKDRKENQQKELRQLEEQRQLLQEKAQEIAEKVDTYEDGQHLLSLRLDRVLKKMQSRVPVLSEAERTMQKELKDGQEKLNALAKSIRQVKTKKDYQERQMAGSGLHSQDSPSLPKPQQVHIKELLRQEGEEINELMKKVNQLKMTAEV